MGYVEFCERDRKSFYLVEYLILREDVLSSNDEAEI